MSYLAPLSYGVLVAHFVPGLLIYATLWVEFWQHWRAWFFLFDKDLWIPFSIASLVVCFPIGLLVDGLRAHWFDNLIRRVSKNPNDYRRPDSLFSCLSNGQSLKSLEFILERYYRFYHLYANTCVSLMLVTLSWLYRWGNAFLGGQDILRPSLLLLLFAVLTTALFFSAKGALKNSIDTLREFRDSQSKKPNFE